MPMLDTATATMTAKMTPPELNNSVAEADKFAKLPLPANFVYPNNAVLRTKLQAYLDALPEGIQETLRATIYLALTSVPPKPMTFKWEGAYDNKIEVTATFDTVQSPRTAGVIGVTLSGRYPGDPHPLADQIAASYGRGKRQAASRRAAKGSPRSAKRKPAKRS